MLGSTSGKLPRLWTNAPSDPPGSPDLAGTLAWRTPLRHGGQVSGYPHGNVGGPCQRHTARELSAGPEGNVVNYTREQVLEQVRAANDQGDPIGPYQLGDDANVITGFLAGYGIAIDADGGVVDLLAGEQ